MSQNRSEPDGTRDDGGASAAFEVEPRAPWEVFPAGVRRPVEVRAASDRAPARFAEAGKIGILERIGELRKEMHRLHQDRARLEGRIEELGRALAEANADRADLAAQLDAARATIAEIGGALDWRKAARSGGKQMEEVENER